MSLLVVLVCWVSTDISVNAEIEIAEYTAGTVLYADGQYEEAVQSFLKTLIILPEDPDLHYYLGRSYHQLGYYGLALEHFEFLKHIIDTGILPDDFSQDTFYYYLGVTHYQIGNRYHDDFSKLTPNPALARKHMEQARQYFQQVLTLPSVSEETMNAANEWLNFIEQESIKYHPLFQEGQQAYERGEYQNAISLFKQTQVDLPSTPLLFYLLGASYYQLQDYKSAQQFFQQVVNLAPESQLAKDALFYSQAIDEFTESLPARPISITATLGNSYDSNVNYGGPAGNIFTKEGDLVAANLPLQDGASILNLSGEYHLNSHLGTRLSSLFHFYWGLGNQSNSAVSTADFNWQTHQLALLTNFPFSNMLSLETDYLLDWQIVGGRSYLFGHKLIPTFTIFENDRLYSRAFASLGSELYPSDPDRDNWNYSLGLEQFIFLWDRNYWLKLTYEHVSVNARDALQQQEGKDSAGTPYLLEFRFANSRASNALGLSFGVPLWFNSRLEVGTQFSFINYTQADIYRQFLLRTNPITGLPLPKLELTNQTVAKFRADTQLYFFIDYIFPINNSWSILARYNRITNVSNILPDDYGVSRSYLKDNLGIQIQMKF